MNKMTKVKIEMSPRDIQKGQQCDAGHCPIALATIRTMRYKFGLKDIKVSVGYKMSVKATDRKTGRERRFWADSPRSVSRFINKFDDNGPNAVTPKNFVVPFVEYV